MAATTNMPPQPDVLRLALLNHFKAALRAKLLEAAKAEIDIVVEEAARALKAQIEQHFEDYGHRMVFNLLVDGVVKAFD